MVVETNKQRARNKPPLRDYSVVVLSKRMKHSHETMSLQASSGTIGVVGTGGISRPGGEVGTSIRWYLTQPHMDQLATGW
jgi:hypothetical protein